MVEFAPWYKLCLDSILLVSSQCHQEDLKKKLLGTEGGNKIGCTDIAEVTSLVSSVVIESDNNIVLDFSTKVEDGEMGTEINEEDPSSTPVTARSDASSTSLLSKVIKVCSATMSYKMYSAAYF